MIAAIAATILPLGFLIVLFGGGALFLRNNIEQDGEAPINRTLFYISKYSILALWGAMVLAVWGISLSVFEVSPVLQVTGLALWFFGFALLYTGRFEMGSSFRLGTPKETHESQGQRVIQIGQKPDVRRYVCNDGCIRPLYAEPGCYYSRCIRDRYPSCQLSWQRRTICRRYLARNTWSIVTGCGDISWSEVRVRQEDPNFNILSDLNGLVKKSRMWLRLRFNDTLTLYY